MKKFMLLLAVCITLISCDNHGKNVSVGNVVVYYQGNGVTEEDAQKLADFMNEQGLAADTKGTVQLTRDEQTYVVRIAYDRTYYERNREHIENIYKYHQWMLSENVFVGETRVLLTDENFNDFADVGSFTDEEKVKLLQNQGIHPPDTTQQVDDGMVLPDDYNRTDTL